LGVEGFAVFLPITEEIRLVFIRTVLFRNGLNNTIDILKVLQEGRGCVERQRNEVIDRNPFVDVISAPSNVTTVRFVVLSPMKDISE
jgi:hypothetical protein